MPQTETSQPRRQRNGGGEEKNMWTIKGYSIRQNGDGVEDLKPKSFVKS